MHIALLNDDHPVERRNSVSAIVGSLADAYRQRGHTVSLITAHDASEDPTIRRTEDSVSIPVSVTPRIRNWHVVFALAPARMVAAELQRLKPDAVHAHNLHYRLGYKALDAAKASGARVILTLHDVMAISENRITTDRFLDSGGQNARLRIADHLEMAGLRWNPLRNAMIRSILGRSTDAVTAVSGALARAMKQNGLTRVTTVHNAIDLAAWDAIPSDRRIMRMAHGIAPEKRVILFGGRLSEDKGAIPLLRTMRTLLKTAPNTLLLVAGDSDRLRGLVEQAGTQDLPNVLSIGWQDQAGLKAAYAAADIVTTPSLCLDAFNLMNLEAMASSKPVVGTIFGGTPEVVEDDVTGFVRDPRTPAYSSALERLLGDDSLAKRMGEAGRKRAESLFTIERQIEEYLRLLSGE